MSTDGAAAFEDQPVMSSSASSPRIIIVDSDPRMRTRLAMQLGETGQAVLCANLEDVNQEGNGMPVIVLAGPSLGDEAGVAQLSMYLRGNPSSQVIIGTEELSTTVLQQALRAGISDVLVLPFEQQQLADAIALASSRLPALPSGVSSLVTAKQDNSGKGRVVTVFSTKGGAGKSVVAINLAVALAQRNDRPVVLLDADLQFGDVAVMLKLTPQHTIVDAVNTIDRMDIDSLKALLVRHEKSGVYVLPAPTEPAFADQISGQTMVKIVELLREYAAYVVIDTPSNFNEVVLAMIEKSDEIVLVAGMDIPNIKNVKIGLQVLRLLEVPSSKLKLVLNRANSKVKLDIPEVERTLQLKADCLVPSDMLIPKSVNRGVPAILDEPRSAVAKSLEGLAELLMASAEAQRQRA